MVGVANAKLHVNLLAKLLAELLTKNAKSAQNNLILIN
jgi:hypothetical protein